MEASVAVADSEEEEGTVAVVAEAAVVEDARYSSTTFVTTHL